MHLKSYIRKQLNDSLTGLKEQTRNIRKSAGILDKTNLEKANYAIHLHSLWEGEKSTTTKHDGSLDEAVKKAEKEFKTANKRQDVQASWTVEIMLGEVGCMIPKEYWAKYREKNY